MNGDDPVVVALDAGNSKTDTVVVDAEGTVLASARTGGFRPSAVGLATAFTELTDGIELALRRAGDPPVELLAAYLANADLPAEEERYAADLTARGYARRVVVGNDTFALLRSGVVAGASAPQGVAVVCGAGINCVGLAPDGSTARFLALGPTTGDWGGGGTLVNEVMYAATRAEDGRGPETDLRPAVADLFGLPTALDVALAVHLGRIPAPDLHALVPVLFDVAAAGDVVARAIARRQAEEVVAMARVALQRLGLDAAPVDVVLGGGVLAGGHRVLLDAVREGVLAVAPGARFVVPDAPPVLGAALLALDGLGLGSEARARAERRLRSGAVAAAQPV
ncbi:N-acetylglucosamine kinase [Kineococcus sp. R86509]|uniref:N-acetylglucosamine kinase n=1 Tax=Kineococcus sp. R86509 TaxID=3093851 RepID=UPI0036D2EBA4